ncbi:MAG TPA: serine protease [Pirellulales bacterium]|jgi:hypothetical protein|nr:serine protease [Pirellulales bacterium]
MPNDRRLLPFVFASLLLVRPTFGNVEQFSLIPVRRAAQVDNSASAERPHPAVVRVMVPEREFMSLGSGTLVDVNEAVGLIVTNWHVVQSAKDGITVVFPDGFRSAAQLIKTDRQWDLAALVCARPNVAPVKLSPMAPRPGEMLTIAGYGAGNYRSATGRCTQYFAPSPTAPNEIVELEADARQGDSGGPIFNSRGELAGVLFGEAKGMTSGSYCGRVDRFLKEAFAGGGLPMKFDAPPPAPRRDTQPPAPMRQSSFPRDNVPALRTSSSVFPKASEPVDQLSSSSVGQTLEPRAPSHESSKFDWQALLGQTPFDVMKTFLAFVGLLSLLSLMLRRPAPKSPHEAMPTD